MRYVNHSHTISLMVIGHQLWAGEEMKIHLPPAIAIKKACESAVGLQSQFMMETP